MNMTFYKNNPQIIKFANIQKQRFRTPYLNEVSVHDTQ